MPGPLYAELDDISNKWGHGDLRATTRQAREVTPPTRGDASRGDSSGARRASCRTPRECCRPPSTERLPLPLPFRQAFQLHGVLKGNLKSVIAAIANIGSNT